jgi:hypothetical protein
MANDLYLLIKELENKSEEKGEWAEISRIKKLLEIEINEVNKIVKETLRI